MKLVINPKYESLRPWLEMLPKTFNQQGEIIYDARNQIRRITAPNGQEMCIKCYHRPIWVNRVIYAFFRPSKAKRAFDNAMRLTEAGIGTPEAVAYIELHKGGLLQLSYLITLQSQLKHINREFTNNYTPELDDTIRPFARFTAQMHEAGFLHKDYSPGNILWDSVDGNYVFEVIDINRMAFGPVSLKQACHSMRRICARTSFFNTFAEEYALARGFDPEECKKWILYYRDQFWKHGKRAQYEYD